MENSFWAFEFFHFFLKPIPWTLIILKVGCQTHPDLGIACGPCQTHWLASHPRTNVQGQSGEGSSCSMPQTSLRAAHNSTRLGPMHGVHAAQDAWKLALHTVSDQISPRASVQSQSSGAAHAACTLEQPRATCSTHAGSRSTHCIQHVRPSPWLELHVAHRASLGHVVPMRDQPCMLVLVQSDGLWARSGPRASAQA